MSAEKKNLVLNISESAEEGFLDFLVSIGCEVITREASKDYELIDFILVDTEEEAKVAARDFESSKNEIDIVCMAPVKETRGFLMSGGRLFVRPGLEKTATGSAILKKFFTKSFDIHLDEAFGAQYSECENFKIINLLSSGLSIDTMAVKAFEKGFNVVALRSFMDHSMAYFTYLKQAGLAGAPFEVEYSFNKETFAINIHAPVKNFAAEYLLDSFGSVNSKDPIQYLLGVVARSADFADITHVEDPGRVVLTGFWSKDSKDQFKGLAFNNIFTTAQLNRQLERKLKAYRPYEDVSANTEKMAEELRDKQLPGGILEMALSAKEDSLLKKDPQGASSLVAFAIGRFEELEPDSALNEMSKEDFEKVLQDCPDQEAVQRLSDEDKDELLNNIHKKNITEAYNEELNRARSSLREDEDFKKEMSNDFSSEVAQRVSGGLDAEALNQIVSGGDQEEEDFKSIVKGAKEDKEKDFVQKISGGFKDNAKSFKATISGSGDDPQKGVFNFVSHCMEGLDDLDVDKRATSFFKTSAPRKIADALEKYAKIKGLAVTDLDEELLMSFQENELPKVVDEAWNCEDSIKEFEEELKSPLNRADGLFADSSPSFKKKFKEKLEQKIDQFQGLEEKDGKKVFTDASVTEEKAQMVIQSAMKEALEEEYRFSEASKEEIDNKEKLVVKDLAKAFGQSDDTYVNSVKEAASVVKNKETQKVVENLFKEAPTGETDKKQNLLETKLLEKIKELENENKKLRGQAQVKLLEDEANSISEQTIQKVDQECAKEREEAGVEAPSVLGENHELEKELRKLQSELNKKESLFSSELAKANKAVKAKELVVEKLKQSMQGLVEKKQAELMGYKRQVEELNQRLHVDRATKLETELNQAVKELESAKKVADLYRGKVESLIKANNKKSEGDSAEQLAAENRGLSRLKIQLENQLGAQQRDKKSLEAQLERLKNNEGKLRARANGTEAKLKQALDQVEKLKTNEARLVALANKKDGQADEKLLREIESLKSTNSQLQGSLKELAEKSKGAGPQSAGSGASGQTPKEKHLEQNVKKLNNELSKARNEVGEQKKQMMKMKNETVALKNKIKQLEKAAQAKGDKGKKAA